MATALDYSAGRPSGAAVRAAGHIGVIRYAGTQGRTKNITRIEYQDMDRNGVGVALVYENKAGDALTGRSGGANSARAIQADAISINFPSSRPLYLACDQDITTQMRAVIDYYRGANDVLGVERTGAYGEADVLDACFAAGVISWGFQTAAWSKGRHTRAHLYQRIGAALVGGIVCDVNDILATDWGQHNAQQEDDMDARQATQLDKIHEQLMGTNNPWAEPGWPGFESLEYPGNFATPVDFIRHLDQNVIQLAKKVSDQQALIIGLKTQADASAKMLQAILTKLNTP